MLSALDVTRLHGPIDNEEIHARLYAGEVLVFDRSPESNAVLECAVSLARQAFVPYEPLDAADILSVEDFTRHALNMRRACVTDETFATVWQAFLATVGVNLARSYWDAPRLRAMPSGDQYQNRRVRPLPAHRDTWGSNLAQQINWWAALYPITAQRTIKLYPVYFSSSVANSSADWNIETLRRFRSQGRAAEYPLLPLVQETLDEAEARALIIEPGEIVAFSAAHLHASVPNQSGITRFSMELRTVDRAHVLSESGAPHMDCATPHTAYEWFKNPISGDVLKP